MNRQIDYCNNKIMIEKNSKNNKQRHIKTQVLQQCQSVPFQFGKPIVRLPIINKKSGALRFRYDNTIDKSLDSKEKSSNSKCQTLKQESCLNVQQLILRKYSNNSQLQLLTFEELQLCSDKSKKILPKIAAMGAPSRQNTDRSMNEDFHRRLNRIKSQKKIDSNTSQLGCYKLGPILGRGNYSIVRLCETSEGKKFAAKVYSKQKINSPQRQMNLQQQIKILKSLNHPSIISFKQYIETQQNHYIVMEVFDNISLTDYIKKQNIMMEQKQQSHSHYLASEPCTSRYREKAKLPENSAKVIMKKILQAFGYLHENGIAHRDIKLENVLVASQKQEIIIKIIDFGFSRRCTLEKQADIFLAEMKENKRQFQRKNSKIQQQDIFYDYCGTPSYMSPEITQKKGYLARPSDVWALGVLLFYLVTGSFPFKVVTQKSDFNTSVFQQLAGNIKLSPSLISMLKKMLKNDPLSRPTIKQLLTKQQWLHSFQ